MAQRMQARAYTVGHDIVLGAGVTVTGGTGCRLLAHELAHIVQYDVSGQALMARQTPPTAPAHTRAVSHYEETPLPAGRVRIRAWGRVGEPIDRPGLEKKYPEPGKVGLAGYHRWHLAGPNATGAEEGIAYAPGNFNVSKTAEVENIIRDARTATQEQGGDVFFDFEAECRVFEHEGVSIRVVESAHWQAQVRAAGSDRLVTILNERAAVPITPPVTKPPSSGGAAQVSSSSPAPKLAATPPEKVAPDLPEPTAKEAAPPKATPPAEAPHVPSQTHTKVTPPKATPPTEEPHVPAPHTPKVTPLAPAAAESVGPAAAATRPGASSLAEPLAEQLGEEQRFLRRAITVTRVLKVGLVVLEVIGEVDTAFSMINMAQKKAAGEAFLLDKELKRAEYLAGEATTMQREYEAYSKQLTTWKWELLQLLSPPRGRVLAAAVDAFSLLGDQDSLIGDLDERIGRLAKLQKVTEALERTAEEMLKSGALGADAFAATIFGAYDDLGHINGALRGAMSALTAERAAAAEDKPFFLNYVRQCQDWIAKYDQQHGGTQ
jgi:hypothetical protein